MAEVPVEEEVDDSDIESFDILEKDAEEEELDRLVLGDGFGFKAQWGNDTEMRDGESEGEGDDAVDQDSEGEAELEDVDDADVRTLEHYKPSRLTFYSSSSSILDHPD